MKKNDLNALILLGLNKNLEKLKIAKIFRKDDLREISILPESLTTTVRTYSHYVLLTSPNRKILSIIYKMSPIRIVKNQITYVSFFVSEENKSFLEELKKNPTVKVLQSLRIQANDDIEILFRGATNKNKTKTKNSMTSRLSEVLKEIPKNEDFIFQQPKIPYFKFYLDKNYYLTYKQIQIKLLFDILIHNTNLAYCSNNKIPDIKIKSNDLKCYLTKDFNVKSLKKLAVFQNLKKEKGYYIFNFARFSEEVKKRDDKQFRNQYILIPVTFWKKLFSKGNFPVTSLTFLIVILNCYHARNPYILYKLSTLIALSKFSKRSKKHLLDILNKNFKLLEKFNIISNFKDFTIDDLKKDNPLKIKLNTLNFEL